MSIVLGANQYGKAENRVVRIYRDTPRHEIRDVNVSTALRGDFSAAHLAGDQTRVLPTDTQKQTVYAYANPSGSARSRSSPGPRPAFVVNDVEPVEAAGSRSTSRLVAGRVGGLVSTTTPGCEGQETRTTILTIGKPLDRLRTS